MAAAELDLLRIANAVSSHGVASTTAGGGEDADGYQAKASESISVWVRDDIGEGIGQLEERIEKLQAAALRLVANDAGLASQLRLLRSIPGIATTSGIQLLSELCVLPADMTAKQWVAHAGLDPRRHQSGSSIDKAVRISKAGNRYVRRALYMPALVALHRDPHVGAFYDHLLERGKARMQAVVAVMRKLLHAAWGMFRSGSTWQGKCFYAGLVETCDSVPRPSRSPEPPAERRPPIAHKEAAPSGAVLDKGAVGCDGRGAIHGREAPSACILPLSGASAVVG